MSKNTIKEELLNKAIAAVENHETALNDTANCGEVDEHVFNLFGGRFYPDNTLNYQMACVGLLTALAKPQIALHVQNDMGEYIYKNLLEMISGMELFCRIMDQEIFRTHFAAFELKEYPSSFSEEQLKAIEIEHTIKRQGIVGYNKIREIAKNGDYIQ